MPNSSNTTNPTIFPVVISLTNLNGVNGFIIDGEATNDASGSSVSAAGDVNGDGYADLLIGAPGHAGGTGRTYVIYGGPQVGSNGLLALNNLNGTNGFKINGEDGGGSGASVSGAGDINNDGYDDVLTGQGNGYYQSGISSLVFGGSAVDHSGSLLLANLNGTNGFLFQGDSASYSGGSLSKVGDFNGDGYADFIVGADGYSSWTGRSYLVFGGREVSTSYWIYFASFFNGTNGFKLDGEQSYDNSGYPVSTGGDFNDDGYADLLIGASNYPDGNKQGRSYLVFGGQRISNNSTVLLSSLNGSNGFKLDGETINDYSGYSLGTAGDVNGDGYDDVVIGAYGYAGSNGRTYVVFGGSEIVSGGILTLSNLNGTNGFKIDGETNGGQSGFIVSTAGDINKDGYSDLFIGAPRNQLNYVVFGGPQVGNSGLLALSDLNGTNGFKISGYGYPISTAGDINSDGIDDLIIANPGYNNNIGRSYVVFGDISPQIWANQLTIHSGETFLFTANNLNATGTVTVSFNVYNVQHGYFQSLSNPGLRITQFTQSQILAHQIQFIHDGSQLAPSYSVQAINRNAIANQAVQVTFYRRPVITNLLSIHQGQTLSLTGNFLNVTEDYPSAQVNLTISNLQYGQFLLAPLNYSVTQFNAEQLLNNLVFFVQDNTTNAPSYQISVVDPYFILPPVSAAVTFYRRPLLVRSNLVISQGQTITLSSGFLTILNEDYPSSQVVITILNVQQGQFKLFNSVVTQFTLQSLLNNQIVFSQDSSPVAPGGLIGFNDPYFQVSPLEITVTFTPLPPIIVNNQLMVLQGRDVTLSLDNLQGRDPDLSFNTSDLIFIISQMQHGQFSLVGSPWQSINLFSQGQISNGQVIFTQDNTVSTPSYEVILTDGRLSSAAQTASISFDMVPIFINNRLTITQGTSVVLGINNLRATDDHTPAGNLLFSVSNVQHGYFAEVLMSTTSITQFSQQQIENAEIEFISDGSALAPIYAVTVTDDAGLSAAPQNAQITFFASGGNSLALVSNSLYALQGRTVILNPIEISAQDLSHPTADLIFTVSNVQNGRFSLLMQPNMTITQFTQQQLNNSQICFTQDGTRLAPSYDLSVSDGALSTLPQRATVIFDQAPVLINNRLMISPGETVTLSPTDILATDDFTLDSGLIFSVSNVTHGYFKTLTDSQVVDIFSQAEIDQSAVAFVQDGSQSIPAYQVTVIDKLGLTTGPAAAQVIFNLPSVDNNSYSTVIRNAITGAIISGVVGFGFFVVQLCIRRRAEKYFEQATMLAEGSTAREQADFHKNVIRPVTKRVLERVKIAGITGYVSQNTARDTLSAIIAIIHQLERQGVDMDLSKLKAMDQTRLVDLIARKTRHALAPDVSCCSVTRLARFFCAETTPQKMEDKAEEIAAKVKAAWVEPVPRRQNHLKESNVLTLEQKTDFELKSFTPDTVLENDSTDQAMIVNQSQPINSQRQRSSSRDFDVELGSPAGMRVFGSLEKRPISTNISSTIEKGYS